jgi:uncharacterized protein (TIGR00297 family)
MSAGSSPSRTRSSHAADALALVSAAALLVMMLYLRAGDLLHSSRHLYLVLATTLGFALAARVARGVSSSGAAVGAVIAFILAVHDLRMFLVLLVVFFVTLAATRRGSSRKRELQLAEAESGRSASQVMANLGVAGLILAIASPSAAYMLALAALAEVAADTTSSEIGVAFSMRTILITNWKRVPAGTNGGISLSGTAAGILAAIIAAASPAALSLVRWSDSILIAVAGIVGMVVDSILGATVERRGYLNNDLVNLLSTAAAAGFAWMLM